MGANSVSRLVAYIKNWFKNIRFSTICAIMKLYQGNNAKYALNFLYYDVYHGVINNSDKKRKKLKCSTVETD